MNSEGEENRICFRHGITSDKRAGLPSLQRYVTAEHAAQPIGLLPHLQTLQSHVARDRGGAAGRKSIPCVSSPHGLYINKLSLSPAHAFSASWT
jgi:hypothetical protein